MIFDTWVFGAFALAFIASYWGIVPQRGKPLALCVAGAVFYAYAVPAYLALIGVLALGTYALCKIMLATSDPRLRRLVLVAGVTASIGVLAFFKYSTFFAATVDAVARSHVLPLPNVIVPLAVSFFTFEFVHVLVDVYLGKIDTIDPLEFAVFALFFPTLVAGPIKRYQSFAPQVRTIVLPDQRRFARSLGRVMLGCAKKIIIADSMNVFIDPISAPGEPYNRIDYVVAVLAYTVKIYADFSAYSDIAIGLAGLLGFRIPENFDRPYGARSIADFWRRWHISLSSWIRDYLFVPLGGSRRNPVVTSVNLFLTMALAGLWHGAAWTFVLWGMWHGIGLAVHRAWSVAIAPRLPWLRAEARLPRTIAVGLTFAFVAVGWIPFAAPSLEKARAVIRQLFF